MVFQASPKFTDLNCHAVRECVVNLILREFFIEIIELG
jgi:hypothetical protein